MLRAGRRNEFNGFWEEVPKQLTPNEAAGFAKRAEIYGNGGGYEKMKLAEKFKLSRKVASRIAAPVGILAPELEQFFPGQGKTMAGWLKSPHRLIEFTVAEGAEYHCEPMAPQLRNERVFDWLETNLRPVR